MISMAYQKLIIPTLIFLLSCPFQLITSIEMCPESFCNDGDNATNPIRFPFHTNNIHRRKTCEYPGFEVTCGPNQTLLQLPNSGNFTIQEIDYIKQEVLLNDPKSCLPNRLLTLDLTGSPFKGVHYQNFSLHNCSGEFVSSYFKYVGPIQCLSGFNFSVFAADPDVGLKLFSSCDLLGFVDVPVRSRYFEESSSDLSEDIRLSWSQPNCHQCVEKGGWCGLKSVSSLDVECYGHSRRDLHALTIGIGVSSLLCLLAIFLCVLFRGFRSRSSSISSINLIRTATPQACSDITGLDQPAIESYPKVVLGESRRVPEPNDITCPICLSEYQPKETLRTLPECSHCFHTDCVDEWLHNHGTCPVCRNSLLHS